VLYQLAALQMATIRKRLGHHMPITVSLRNFIIMPPVALNLAVDSRTVSTKRF